MKDDERTKEQLVHELAGVRQRMTSLETSENERKQAERAHLAANAELQEMRRYLTGLIESSTDAIISTDKEGNVVLFNTGAQALLGYRAEEVIGQRVTILYESEERAKDVMRQMRKGGGAVSAFETALRAKDGRSMPVLISASILHDEAGQETGTVGFNKDLRERKRAEEALQKAHHELEKRVRERTADLTRINESLTREIAERKRAEEALLQSEERTRLIVQSALDAVITMDAQSLITDWNPHAETIFGWSREEAIGRPLAETIIPPQYREPHHRGLQQFLATGEGRVLNKRIEITAVHRDGHEFPVELSISPLRSGETFAFSAFLRDITERRRAEEALQRAKEEAEAVNQAKSVFLANMGHELRTPLNHIIGYSEMLQEEAEEADQEEFIPDLQKIRGAGKHLLELINAILDLSKIEAGKMDLLLETITIAPMIQDIVTTMKPLVDKNANTLEVHCADDLGTMWADPTKVRQALFNLLSNACKFTERGTITLRVIREMVDAAAWIRFRVTDAGIGMTPEQIGKLFQAFHQADASATRKYSGTGLGLAISQRICQMMGGEITVESALGQGSTFTISLPAMDVRG